MAEAIGNAKMATVRQKCIASHHLEHEYWHRTSEMQPIMRTVCEKIMAFGHGRAHGRVHDAMAEPNRAQNTVFPVNGIRFTSHFYGVVALFRFCAYGKMAGQSTKC